MRADAEKRKIGREGESERDTEHLRIAVEGNTIMFGHKDEILKKWKDCSQRRLNKISRR